MMRVESAQRERRLIACGFTANLDRVATFDQDAADRLFAAHTVDVAGPRVTRVGGVDELLAGVAQCVGYGEGCDLPVDDLAVRDWLLERVTGRVQIGGTGAQAAATLATLGFPALLHLTSRSPELIAALPNRERIAVGSPDGLLPVEVGSDSADPAMWHVVLEFAAGLRVPGPAAPVAPAPNRVIVSYDPVNSSFAIDPGFDAALNDPGLEIGTVLISGFSQITARETLERVLWDAAVALRIWRAVRPELLVHLELGAMPDAASITRILQVLHPLAGSIGLNIDELRQLLRSRGVVMASPGPELVDQFRSLAECFPAPRWSLHTRELCLTLTTRDPGAERDALLFGSLVAAARSRVGGFPDFADLAAAQNDAGVNPVGMDFLRTLGIADDGYGAGGLGADGLVVTPGLTIDGTRASVGLGDSFTAGVLAVL